MFRHNHPSTPARSFCAVANIARPAIRFFVPKSALFVLFANARTAHALPRRLQLMKKTSFISLSFLLPWMAIGLAAAPAANAGLFSATGAVIAILGGELFVGEAEGHLGGAGTLTIRSQKQPDLSCSGDFTSSVALGGSGQFSCSDGTRSTFHFKRLTIFSGHGSGSFSRGPMNFSYGLTAEEAAPYLTLPEGKKLVQNGAQIALVDL
jgi:hypothetical protein